MKIDLHIHTNFSYDGLSSLEEILKATISKNLNGICITDHGKITPFFSKEILVIPGIEIRAKEGEILGINVREKIEDNLSAKETIGKIIEQGGLAAIPHPFEPILSFKEIEKLAKFFQEKKVAIEVFNASLFFDFANRKAFDFAKKFNLPFIAGSDSHSADFVGKAFIEIERENLTIEKILEEIKNKNIKIGFEKISFFEKLGDHLKRNLAKVRNYVRRKSGKI